MWETETLWEDRTDMKKLAGILILLTVVAIATPAMYAQEEHGQFTVFADYVRLRHANNANFWGPGAAISFNARNWLAFEAGMAYDPERTISTTNTAMVGTTTTTTTMQEGLRLWHGMFGPKISTGFHSARLYFVAKGGFLNFNVSNAGIANGFNNAVGGFTTGDTNGVFYPGVGIELGKRFGIRAEVGDLMYFDNGVNHNLRLQVGPKISF